MKINEYFDGKVKSIAFSSAKGSASVGVMTPGEYEFGTTTIEFMTIISGKMKVMLPDDTDWTVYSPFETFIVGKNRKFKIQVKEEDCSYLCLYR